MGKAKRNVEGNAPPNKKQKMSGMQSLATGTCVCLACGQSSQERCLVNSVAEWGLLFVCFFFFCFFLLLLA